MRVHCKIDLHIWFGFLDTKILATCGLRTYKDGTLYDGETDFVRTLGKHSSLCEYEHFRTMKVEKDHQSVSV